MDLMLVKAVDPRLCQHLSACFLSPKEQDILSTLRHSLRAADYLTSRLAIKSLLIKSHHFSSVDIEHIELIAPPSCPPRLYLNQCLLADHYVSVSHSRGLVVVAHSIHDPLGIDIEHITGRDWASIYSYMNWPLPTDKLSFPRDHLCCCAWTVYEAGFKLFAGKVNQDGFVLEAIVLEHSLSNNFGQLFSFSATFAELSFVGHGLVTSNWVLAIAIQA